MTGEQANWGEYLYCSSTIRAAREMRAYLREMEQCVSTARLEEIRSELVATSDLMMSSWMFAKHNHGWHYLDQQVTACFQQLPL